MTKQWKQDYYRMLGYEWKLNIRSLLNFLFMHNVRYMYWWRKAKNGSLFAKYKVYRYSRKYGLEISLSSNIDSGLYLGHPYNITVGGDVKIGKNVNIHKGATIGATTRGKAKGSPVIGNNVFIGINSTVVGGINIGDDVLIAPNSYVNFDVPSHSIVIGNPGKINPNNFATQSYVVFCI